MGDTKWITYKRRETYEDYLFAILFFLATAYFFVGIAIASDIFMSAIEKICGATRKIKETKEEDGVVVVTHKEVLVWNETVANLTLMALGSSAPEILLSVIEISEGLGKQESGELGPGTIVGSAAFNLMVISALCILCLKDGETSRIKLYNVFTITCCSSLFAYIWMVVVLQWVTPDQIDLWEALLTLAFSPILVGISYWADQDFCVTGRKRKVSIVSEKSAEDPDNRAFYFGDQDHDNLYNAEGNVDRQALKNLYTRLMDIALLTPDEIATILATKLIQSKPHTRSWYRQKAARVMLGSGSNMPTLDERLQEVIDVLGEKRASQDATHGVSSHMLRGVVTSPETYEKKAVVEFQAAALAVSEGVGSFQVHLNRLGKEDIGFKITVESVDGTAKSGAQYEKVSETITFDPYVKEQTVTVKIIDNADWNPDSNFFLKLTVLPDFQEKAVSGQMRVIEIIIEDDEKPGKLEFTRLGYLFKASNKVGYIEVQRSDGTDGTVAVGWKVTPGPKCTIVSPHVLGKLKFDPGELKKSIEIPFVPFEGEIEGRDQTFEVELCDPEGGAKLGKLIKVTCAVSGDNRFKLEINDVVMAAIQKSEEADEDISYKDQIIQAILPNDGDVKGASPKQWVIHILVFPFKFILSLIPPPQIAGGWLCFVLALCSIGFLTKLVGETAGSFGLSLQIHPVLTAITFVALGTSLPDTFASMIAARNDKTADNAIGNVTGSNSVNVFLGLGLPWTIGALYYKYTKLNGNDEEQPFCVPAGALTFNVSVFTLCAFVTIAILVFRRFSSLCGKAELGGPKVSKWITAVILLVLWFLYIILCAIQVYFAPQIGDDGILTQCEALIESYKRKPGK